MAVGPSELPGMPQVKGLRLSAIEAGIRYPNRKDLVLFECAEGSSVAGVFTQNAFCAAPVHIAKEHLAARTSDQKSYFIINTGNANAGTGKQGFDDANLCCQALSELVGVDRVQVLPFSTGVIGEKLPSQVIVNALPNALNALSGDQWINAASGIMTTDTRPKAATRTIQYGSEEVVISGISKGAGMIKPNMATMLCFIATDANIPQALLQSLSSELADKSFNRITIDGDTSTNDACMCVATGASMSQPMSEGDEDFSRFKNALEEVYIELAHAIVRDGEGATKFVTIAVDSAKSSEEALAVAYTVAHSPLVKTALFASDPNWGRILAALGRAGVKDLDLDSVRIYLGEFLLVEDGGRASSYTEEQGQSVMNQEEIEIRIELHRGEVSETVWTTDLSKEYVAINADYRS